MSIYTTSTGAAELGCAPATVLRHATRLGLGIQIRGAIALSPADIEQIRGEIKPVGNPNMVAGNDLWRGPKKSKKRGRKLK